jgi:predicted DNA-binding transcriptional regulator AlpA
MEEAAQEDSADLTSVRTLVTSVTALARHLGLTNNAIYRWINVNRIPGRHIVKVANFYDVGIREMLPLTGSEESNEATFKIKPRGTLHVLQDVYRGTKTLDEGVAETGQSKISLKLILSHWGDELPTLFTTLEQLREKRISLDEAAARLKVAKYTLHGIRRKYGYAPGPTQRTRPFPTIGKRKALNQEVALKCIAGHLTVHEAADKYGMSERTLFRAIEKLSPVKMMELSPWPPAFREALAAEIEHKLPTYSLKWLELAETSRLYTVKTAKYPETPRNWRDLPLKRLLVGVLLGEGSLEDIAASRGADPGILRTLFTGDLRPMGVTFEQPMELPMTHQVAAAELLIAMVDRKRELK